MRTSSTHRRRVRLVSTTIRIPEKCIPNSTAVKLRTIGTRQITNIRTIRIGGKKIEVGAVFTNGLVRPSVVVLSHGRGRHMMVTPLPDMFSPGRRNNFRITAIGPKGEKLPSTVVNPKGICLIEQPPGGINPERLSLDRKEAQRYINLLRRYNWPAKRPKRG